MEKSNKQIWEWQKKFYAQPKVWIVYDRGDSAGSVQNIYESRAAAQYEIDYHKKRGQRICCRGVPIHSLALSQERWCS